MGKSALERDYLDQQTVPWEEGCNFFVVAFKYFCRYGLKQEFRHCFADLPS